MRIAVSNIAWDPDEDTQVAALLRRYSVNAIDVAPGKYFPEPARAKAADMMEVRRRWNAEGIELTGMQALLFGTKGLNVFGDKESRTALLEHLQAVARIGEHLGATRLVFGSPKNRDRSGLDDNEAFDRGVAFFQQVGEIARQEGVLFCLEPNPTCYGANFMTTTAETVQVVEAVGCESIKMQFDTGALFINGEDPDAVLRDYGHLVGHVHVSERDLVPIGDGGGDHSSAAQALRDHLPHQIATIEMRATTGEPHLDSIERALALVTKVYRQTPGAIQTQ